MVIARHKEREKVRHEGAERWPLVAGAAAVPLMVAGGITTGSASGVEGTPAPQIAELLVANQGQLRVGVLLVGLSVLALMAFTGGLRAMLQRRGGSDVWGTLAVGGGWLAGFLLLLTAALSLAAWRSAVAGLVEPAAAYIAASTELFHATAFPLGVLVGAASYDGLRNRAVPAWASWAGIAFGGAGVIAWPFEAVAVQVLHLALLWILVSAIVLTRRGGREFDGPQPIAPPSATHAAPAG